MGGPTPGDAAADLGWLLDDLAARVGHFRRSVILSRDGLVVAASSELPRDDAERLAALAAGVQSLAAGAGQQFGVGDVRQTIIELQQALLFITAAGNGSCLAVLCPADADAWPGRLRDGQAGHPGRAAPGGATAVPGRGPPGGVSQRGSGQQMARPELRSRGASLRGDRRPDRAGDGELLDLIAVVVEAGPADGDDDRIGLSPEHRRILSLCKQPATVADVASDTGLPLGVVRVLIADLIVASRITVLPQRAATDQPSAELLREVLHGLRAL